jgi:hypothetical protein
LSTLLAVSSSRLLFRWTCFLIICSISILRYKYYACLWHLRWDRRRIFDQISQEFGGTNSERGTRDGNNILICVQSVSFYWNVTLSLTRTFFLGTDCCIYCRTSDGGWRCNTSTRNLFWQGNFSSSMLQTWVHLIFCFQEFLYEIFNDFYMKWCKQNY